MKKVYNHSSPVLKLHVLYWRDFNGITLGAITSQATMIVKVKKNYLSISCNRCKTFCSSRWHQGYYLDLCVFYCERLAIKN